MTLDEINTAIQAAVDEAYARGVREGSEKAAARFVEAMRKMAAESIDFVIPDSVKDAVSAAVAEKQTSGEGSGRDHRGRRAPRGLTKKIVHRVLGHGIGLPMAEVQRRAVAEDSRVSAKTVYNELYREPEYYKDGRGNWQLLSPAAAAELKATQLPLRDATQEREPGEAPTAH